MKDKNIFVPMHSLSNAKLKNHCYPPFAFKGCSSFFVKVHKYENLRIVYILNKMYINSSEYVKAHGLSFADVHYCLH